MGSKKKRPNKEGGRGSHAKFWYLHYGAAAKERVTPPVYTFLRGSSSVDSALKSCLTVRKVQPICKIFLPNGSICWSIESSSYADNVKIHPECNVIRLLGLCLQGLFLCVLKMNINNSTKYSIISVLHESHVERHGTNRTISHLTLSLSLTHTHTHIRYRAKRRRRHPRSSVRHTVQHNSSSERVCTIRGISSACSLPGFSK